MNVAQCDCNQKPKSFLSHVLRFQDNLQSLSTNGFPESNFPNFGFAPQTHILIHIFINVAQSDCNQKPKSFLLHVLSFQDNSTSFSTNGFPGSNFPNFGFAPHT